MNHLDKSIKQIKINLLISKLLVFRVKVCPYREQFSMISFIFEKSLNYFKSFTWFTWLDIGIYSLL